MSRYSIPATHSEHRVAVGWDSPLTSFFAEVIDQRIETAIEHGELSEDNDDPMLLWIGTTLGELPTLEELQRERCFADTARVASFATIPNDIVEQLQSDYDQRWSQTESGLFRD